MAKEFELILRVIDDDGSESSVSLGQICRGTVADTALLGLELAQSKQLLTRLQQELVTVQFKSMSHARRACACCGTMLSIKDYQNAKFRSLFGDVTLRVPRYVKCDCPGGGQRKAQRRWLSAELEWVQSELAARLSYQHSTDLLRMLLPIGKGHSASTVRARTLRVGQRMDAELAGAQAPGQTPPKVTTIGLDGGYVLHCDAQAGHNFEIIAGRVLAEDGSQRSVGFVRSVDADSRTRVQHAVTGLGAADGGLHVFTDGDGRLRDLQLAVLPDATHVLDWYHLTRRLTILSNVISGKPAATELQTHDQDRLSEWMECLKWRLWNGQPEVPSNGCKICWKEWSGCARKRTRARKSPRSRTC